MPIETISLPFVGGQDEGIAARVLPPGERLTRLENGRFTKRGELRKRGGLGTALSADVYATSAQIGDAAGIYSLDDALCWATQDGGLYVRHDAEEEWVDSGTTRNVVVTGRRGVARSPSDRLAALDTAYTSGHMAVAYLDVDELDIYVTIWELSTGAVVERRRLINSVDASRARILVDGSTFITLWDTSKAGATGTIEYDYYNVATGTGGTGTALSDLGDVSSEWAPWDAATIVQSDGDVYHYVTHVAGDDTDVEIARMIWNGATFATSVVDTPGGGEGRLLALASDSADQRLLLAVLGTPNLLYVERFSVGADGSLTSQGSSSITASINPVRLVCGWNDDDDAYGYVFWCGLSGTPERSYTEYGRVDGSGNIDFVSDHYDAWIAGYPVSYDGSLYLPVIRGVNAAATSFERSFLLLGPYQGNTSDNQGDPCAIWAYGDAATPGLMVNNISPGDVYLPWTPRVAEVSDGTDYALACTVVSSGRIDDVEAQTGVDVVRWSYRDTRGYDPQVADGAAYLPGGYPTLFDGVRELDASIVHAPDTYSVSVTSATGSLSAGDYVYLATYEVQDDTGRVVRSAAGVPIEVTATTTSSTAELVLPTLQHQQFADAASIRVWRTEADGADAWYEVTDDGGLANDPSQPTVTFTDTLSDTDLIKRSILYQVGGVLPNRPAPACRTMALLNNRLFAAGLEEDPYGIRYTAPIRRYLAPEWKLPFLLRCPRPIVALASNDDVLVAFASDEIYLIYGEGPDALGLGAFASPRTLSTDVGCIDTRSIVESQAGVFFQSARGIELLPKGGGAPQWVGEPVSDTLDAHPYVVGAVLDGERQLVRWVLSTREDRGGYSLGSSESYTCVTFEYKIGAWSVDTYTLPNSSDAPRDVAFWRGDLVWQSQDDVAYLESESTYNDQGNHYSLTIETGDMRFAALHGYQRVRSVTVLAELRAACTLGIETRPDDSVAYVESGSWSINAATGSQITRQYMPQVSRCAGMRVRLTDDQFPEGAASEALRYYGLVIELQRQTGARRLTTAERG